MCVIFLFTYQTYLCIKKLYILNKQEEAKKMNNIDNLAKLAELKEKGVISESEFNQQKENILKNLDTQSSGTPKSRLAYILLALFFGGLGIHNFYAGYTGKGITQLLLCVLLFWLVIPLIIVGLWVVIEIITVTKDAKGIPFN